MQNRIITCAEFDTLARKLAVSLKDKDFKFIYGQPRGGLCLSVMLSHLLNKPMSLTLNSDCLWVDDLVETGKQFGEISHLTGHYAVLIMKNNPDNYQDVIFSDIENQNRWIVFPYEN